jgi:hypothetical protein
VGLTARALNFQSPKPRPEPAVRKAGYLMAKLLIQHLTAMVPHLSLSFSTPHAALPQLSTQQHPQWPYLKVRHLYDDGKPLLPVLASPWIAATQHTERLAEGEGWAVVPIPPKWYVCLLYVYYTKLMTVAHWARKPLTMGVFLCSLSFVHLETHGPQHNPSLM